MKIIKIEEIEYSGEIYTPQIKDNENYFLGETPILSKNCQNYSKRSLLSVISRMDKDCKIICIGSNRQIDHPYITKYNNGLSTLLKVAKEENEEVKVFGTELNKVVRGKLTEWAERIFEKK